MTDRTFNCKFRLRFPLMLSTLSFVMLCGMMQQHAHADIAYSNTAGPNAISPFASAGELIEFTPAPGMEVIGVQFGIGLPATGNFDFDFIVEFYDDYNPGAGGGMPVHESLLSAFNLNIDPFTVSGAPASAIITSDDLRLTGTEFLLPEDGDLFYKITIVRDSDGLVVDPNTEASLLYSLGGVGIGSSPDWVYGDVNNNGVLEAIEQFNLSNGSDNFRFQLTTAAVPEPSAAIACLAFPLAVVMRRRRSNQ